MAIGTQLTLAGAKLLSKAMQGKQLLFTRGAFGDAKVNGQLVDPTQEQKDALNALIHEKMSLPIYYYEFGENGDLIVAVKVKNNNLTSNFKAAEAGLFAQDPDTGAEILYGYCYEGADGDMIHAKSSYCVLEYYVELVTTIGNATNVTCNVNIKEKIKAGNGLSRAGDTLNVNTGTGLSISAYNNVYLKRATDTEKGGVIITGNDGLIMDEETLKVATGTGLSISSAGNVYLKRASSTEKGGVIITGNDGLEMDGETLKATGGGDFEGRVKQLEINQSNLFMVLNANNILGVTANLLLVEDFVKCDCTDTTSGSCFIDDDVIRYKNWNPISDKSFAKIGRYYTLRCRDKEAEVLIPDIIDSNLQSGEQAYVFYFDGDLSDFDGLNAPAKVYRTTAGIVKGKYAYGPGVMLSGYLNRSFTGSSIKLYATAELDTSTGKESNFDLSGDSSLTSDGYFTIG